MPTGPIMEGPPGPVTLIDGQPYVYFGGTGYLGLAGHPEVIEAACAALRRYGVHSATSRQGFGNNPVTLEVERNAAAFFGTEDAFYFTSGYIANHIMVQALAGRVDAVFVDETSHFCVMEAARLAGKPLTQYAHRNPADLALRLRETLLSGQRPLVLTDGVFPISGAVAPVPDYLRELERYPGAVLHLDDAHGFGVLGPEGRGVFDHFGWWGAGVNSGAGPKGVTLTVCGTLAKAIGGFGGIIPGSRDFVQAVRSATHYYDGASAPSSADAGATAKALELVRQQPELRDRLRQNIRQLRTGLRALDLEVENGPSANFGVRVGDAANMRRLHAGLRAAGFLVPYVSVYSGLGPEGALRFAACTLHTTEMIEGLLANLKKLL